MRNLETRLLATITIGWFLVAPFGCTTNKYELKPSVAKINAVVPASVIALTLENNSLEDWELCGRDVQLTARALRSTAGTEDQIAIMFGDGRIIASADRLRSGTKQTIQLVFFTSSVDLQVLGEWHEQGFVALSKISMKLDGIDEISLGDSSIDIAPIFQVLNHSVRP